MNNKKNSNYQIINKNFNYGFTKYKYNLKSMNKTETEQNWIYLNQNKRTNF